MNTHRIAVLLVPILLAAPDGLLGQEPTIVEGSRVRVTAPDVSSYAFEGTVVALKPDTLTVEADVWRRGGWESGRWDVPVSAMTSLERARKGRSKILKGAAIGGGIGAVVGLIGTLAVVGSDSWYGTVDARAALVPLGIGAIGAGIGGIIGAMSPRTEWVSVPLNDFQANLGTFGDGVSLSISVRH